MILKSALMLLLLMASRQAEITWFLGLPTEGKEEKQQMGEIRTQIDMKHTTQNKMGMNVAFFLLVRAVVLITQCVTSETQR